MPNFDNCLIKFIFYVDVDIWIYIFIKYERFDLTKGDNFVF